MAENPASGHDCLIELQSVPAPLNRRTVEVGGGYRKDEWKRYVMRW